jgi:glycosyltransferase involved in cell wall biosynthesis
MLAKNSLSVIIPYYKRRYFDRTLACLAGQEDKSFLVFIGDDGSPEDCCSLIEKYSGSLTIKYRRYTENIGHRSLVSHWNRCVRDTTSDWVWLFSDDDIASSDCVGSFRESLDETEGRYNVYRFPTKIIDGSGAIIHCPPLPPRIESAEEMLLARMEGRSSSAVEYIFRRQVFEAENGFVDFPLGWYSDDASWCSFARSSGIYTMIHGEVYWRQSGANISSPTPENFGKKLLAFSQFLQWAKARFPDDTLQGKFRSLLRGWFPKQLEAWGPPASLGAGLRFWLFFSFFTRRFDLRLLRGLIRAQSKP